MDKEKSILIVDDEEDLLEILQYNLINEGYRTDVASSAEEALKMELDAYDLFILDVMMGEMSGFRLADKLRKEFQLETPVIFLTAKDTENDMLTGFSLGADDYMTKPFSVNELKARVKAVLKRYPGKPDQKISKHGSIEFDNTRKRVLIEGEPVEFTRKEYEILTLLVESNGKIFSREDLLRKIWGGDVIVTDRTVDVNITRIRNKLGKNGHWLKNRTGYGYYFEF